MNKITMNELSTEVQESVKSDLYMYDKTYVTFENGKYTTSPHTALTSTPNAHDFKMFVITRDDVYTAEEQEQNKKVFNEETKNMDWEWFGR